MAEITKTPLTFEDIKEVAEGNTELNMLMDGTAYGKELLTPKAYLSFLVQLRTAKGQNAKSIFTEKELEDMDYELPKYDVATFYNEEGEKCYDLALISNKADVQKDLRFEETLDTTLRAAGQKLDETKLDITKDDFDTFNKAMAQTFGIEMNIESKYSVYDSKFFRSIGRKVVNLFAGRDGRVKSAGTLFIAKPEFTAAEGTPERAKEEEAYYKNCIIQYTDLLAKQTTSISFADYKEKLLASPEFKALDKEEQKRVLNCKKELFKGDAEIFNSIVRDLVASEMVKTMPNLSAKMRYELNQAYILRACQSLASLDEGFVNDTIIIKAMQDAVRQPVLKFNKRLGLTPEEVAQMNAEVKQESQEAPETLEEAIFGSKNQLFVKEFGYGLSPEFVKDPTAEVEVTEDSITETEVEKDPTTEVGVTEDRITENEVEKDPTANVEVAQENTNEGEAEKKSTQTRVEDFIEEKKDTQTRIEDFINGDSSKAPVKDKEIKPTHEPPFVRDEKTIDVEGLPQEKIEDMVNDYINIRINRAVAHLARYAESEGKTEAEIKFLENVRDNYNAETASDKLTADEAKMIDMLVKERESFVSNFMEDYNNYKAEYEKGNNNGEWLQAKSIPALLKRWMSDPEVNTDSYQKGLKTFRGNYERYIRRGVAVYAKSFAKNQEPAAKKQEGIEL